MSTSTSAPAPPTIQNGVTFGVTARVAIGRHVARDVAADADDVAGLHACISSGTARRPGRCCPPAGRRSRAQRRELVARVLGREPHRVAHVEERARAERRPCHRASRRCRGARPCTASAGTLSTSADDLRHARCRSPAPCRPCCNRASRCRRPTTLTIATEVVGEIDALKPIAMPRPRRTVPLPRSNGPAPVHPHAPARSSTASIAASCMTRAGRLRAAVAQDVLAAELDRVELERARDHVGVALVGPHQLRDAEAAQRAGRRQVGVERNRNRSRTLLDVVGPGAVKPDFCVTRGPISA